jgi:SET domain-containing protein 6
MHMGWVGLILCMMWETAQGSSSKWSKYLGSFVSGIDNAPYELTRSDSLPTTFDTPMFWSDLELEELKGTSVVGLSIISYLNLSRVQWRTRETRES